MMPFSFLIWICRSHPTPSHPKAWPTLFSHQTLPDLQWEYISFNPAQHSFSVCLYSALPCVLGAVTYVSTSRQLQTRGDQRLCSHHLFPTAVSSTNPGLGPDWIDGVVPVPGAPACASGVFLAYGGWLGAGGFPQSIVYCPLGKKGLLSLWPQPFAIYP